MDSLRVEAGYCAYGKELGEDTSPVEVGMSHLIPKKRWDKKDFTGYNILNTQIEQGVKRKRAGFAV